MANARFGCQCGETVFDLSGRKPGSLLSCPFCQRKYTYVRDALVEPFEAEGAASEDRAFEHQPKLDLFEEPPSATEEKADAPARRRFSPAFIHNNLPPRTRAPRKSDGSNQKPVRDSVRIAPPDAMPRSRLRKLLPNPDLPIPGGAATMIAAIILSVFASLAVLSVVLPAHPDGSRTAPWGEIHKEAIWPEITALILGHIVGFFCWSFYVHVRFKVLKKKS